MFWFGMLCGVVAAAMLIVVLGVILLISNIGTFMR